MKMGKLTMIIAVLLASMFTLGKGALYQFVSEPRSITLLEGDDAEITCDIDKTDDSSPDAEILWQQVGGALLGEGNSLWSADPRMEVYGANGRFTLIIRDVGLSDEGAYSCQVKRTSLQLTTTVEVNVEPSIYETSFVEEFVDLEKGESIELTCKAMGKPNPTITWTKVDGPLPSGDLSSEGETLLLDNVGEAADGDYECTASNGAGSPKTEIVTLNVNFAPDVQVSEEFIHTGPGNDVTIHCTFSANPEVYAEWLHNDEHVDTSINPNIEITNKIEQFKQIASLSISNLGKDNLGTYECLGFNDLGNASAVVELSAMPHNLRITSEPYGLYSDQYVLEWKVTSVPDLIEYHLKIGNKVNGTEQYAWVDQTIPAPNSQRKVRRDKYLLAELDVNQTYAIKLRAVNEFGLTEWTELFEFKTSKEINLAPLPTTSTVSTTETRTQTLEKMPESVVTKRTKSPSDDEMNLNGASSLCSVFSYLMALLLFANVLH